MPALVTEKPVGKRSKRCKRIARFGELKPAMCLCFSVPYCLHLLVFAYTVHSYIYTAHKHAAMVFCMCQVYISLHCSIFILEHNLTSQKNIIGR